MRSARFLIGVGTVVLCLVGVASGDGVILHKSGPIQITNNGGFVWAVNPDHDSVSRIQIGSQFYNISQFPLPVVTGGGRNNPQGLALSPVANEVWVAAPDADRVYILDTTLGSALATIVLPVGSSPSSVAISADGTRALVALHRAGGVAVISTATRTVTTIIGDMYRHPLGITFTSNPDEAWVSHSLPDGEDSYISALDLTTNTVKALVPLKFVNPRNTGQVADDPVPVPEGGYIVVRGHVAQPPGINQLWIPCQYHNRQNDTMLPDSTVNAALHKIDLSTFEHFADNRCVLSAVYAHTTQSVLIGDGWNAHISGPVDIAFSADGATAYMLNTDSNDVVVFPTNITLDKPVASDPLPEINVGDNPTGIVASPTSSKLFVLNYLSRNVSVINTQTLAVEANLSLTFNTPEPVPAPVLLGAKLFSSSADLRLSSSGKVSCASCHPGGEADSQTWEFAQFGAGSRKALSLLGIALSSGPQVMGRGQFHRAGDRDELQDFALTFLLPFMNGSGILPSANPPLGAPNAGLTAEADGLAAFMTSLPALQRSPHRAPDGSLPEGAVRGAELFKATSGPLATNCSTCHTAPNFTDLSFHDVGGYAPAPDHQAPLFNTPSLVGSWDTGPYRQAAGPTDYQSLGGVIRNARTGVHGNTAGLNLTQQRDLELFLNCIDGQMSQTGIDTVIDTSPPRVVAVRPISLNSVQVLFSETVDQATAEDTANFTLSDGLRTYTPTSATLDATGRRVKLTVALRYFGCPVTYTLAPGAVQDVAGVVNGSGVNNELDTADPANHGAFTLDGSIRLTFGSTGDEMVPSVAHDAAFDAALPSMSYAAWRVYPNTPIPTKSFVKFDFIPTLATECGVTDPADIQAAGFSVKPKRGAATTVELRRCLMPWNEPPRDQCLGCPGSVNRSNATHPTIPWHQSGARAIGGTGTDPAEYYPTASFDVASTVDAAVTIAGMNERLEFASPGITDAFRFWLAHPTINFGYVVNAVGPSVLGTEFWANEDEGGKNGITLTITYAIHPQTPFDDCNNNGIADDCDLLSGVLHDANGDGTPDECVCLADFNGDHSVNSQDFFDFLDAFFASAPTADFNMDGLINSQDFFDYLTAFFAGCP